MERWGGNASTSKSPVAKLDQKTVEKNRRNQMHQLLQNLFSLIPSPSHIHPNSKEGLAMPERLQQATSYVEQLRERVGRLKERKAEASALGRDDKDEDGSRLPELKITDLHGNWLQVIVVIREGFAVSNLVRVLEEEGAEMVGVNIATVGDKVYHTFHAQVKIPRIGVDISRIAARIHDLISDEYSI